MRAASAAARPNADGGSSSSSGPSRSWLLTALALAIALAVPFFVVDVPPVLDYPNHLARYFVLAIRMIRSCRKCTRRIGASCPISA